MNKIEIEINKLIDIINLKITEYYGIYHCEPKVLIVPDYVEYFLQYECGIKTSVAFNDKKYSSFMGILLVGTKDISDIKQIKVF